MQAVTLPTPPCPLADTLSSPVTLLHPRAWAPESASLGQNILLLLAALASTLLLESEGAASRAGPQDPP